MKIYWFTKIVCIAYRTKKVMQFKNISGTEMRCAQTREFDCTKQIVGDLQNGIHGPG